MACVDTKPYHSGAYYYENNQTQKIEHKTIMKKITILLLLCVLVSCGKKQDSGNSTSDNKSTTSGSNTETKSNPNEPQKDSKVSNSPYVGTYTGGFQASKFDDTKDYVFENRITISIDSLSGEMIYGHSVVAGNNRPFKGTFKMDGNTCNAEVSEPGDDKYDGKFNITINPEATLMEGLWKANDKKLEVSERTFTLDRKQFKYEAAANLPDDIKFAEL